MLRMPMVVRAVLVFGLSLGFAACAEEANNRPDSGGTNADASTGSDVGLDDLGGASDSAGASDSLADGGVGDAGGDGATGTPSGRIAFADSKQVCDATCSATTFDIGTLRELYIHTLWDNLSGMHVELRQIFLPDGNLYQQKLVVFDTEAAAAVPFDPPQTIPHTRNVQVPETNSADQFVVWDYLLVGGTDITTRQLVGQWRVAVLLDKLSGDPDLEATFTLE